MSSLKSYPVPSAKQSSGQALLTTRSISLIGAECTGKSSLGLALAELLPGVYIPEILRDFCMQKGRTPQIDEQALILQQQIKEEELALLFAKQNSLSWVVSDSSPLMTALYSVLYFQDTRLLNFALAHQRRYTLTFLLDIDLPWVADGIQRDSPSMQAKVHKQLLHLLKQEKISYTLISGQARLQTALEITKALLLSSAKPYTI